MTLSPADRLIVALDVPTGNEAAALARRLAPLVATCKVGLRLLVREGPAVVGAVRAAGVSVFLDAKLHDIPSTVAAAARAAADLGASMLTVHASAGAEAVRAAAAAAPGVRLLAVTVLTSLSDSAQRDLFGGAETVEERVARWACLALEAGAAGVVCSPREAAAVRAACAAAGRPEAWIVTPGVRPSTPPADQARTGTVAEALRAGATHLVVGRPILEAADPAAVVRALLAEIESASA